MIARTNSAPPATVRRLARALPRATAPTRTLHSTVAAPSASATAFAYEPAAATARATQR